ncbi:anti-sigma factor family protein [Brevundimonas sp. FT23042]|uniref:anti-sigma factor family protein n=1 Tax=Brevundimonas sp. FT23042 TaxID=3393749 RepID=UPI003B58A2F9
MTAFDDETLMRWSDGELSPDEAARLEASALTDPGLAKRMQALRRIRTAAREAFPAAVDPRDADLARLISSGPVKAASPLAGLGRRVVDAFSPRRAVAWAGLAAAAFVGGVLIGPMLDREGDGLRVSRDGGLADAGLIRVLDDRLASEGPDSDGRAVGVTFQDGEQRWCRTFQAANAGLAGLACREGDGWAVRVLAPLGAAGGEVRTASSDTPEPVLAAVDAAIVGQAADALAEARARDAGWR